MIKINEIKSAYVISIYILLIGLFLLFHELFGFKLDSSEVSIYIIKERGTYYLMSALLIFQYNYMNYHQLWLVDHNSMQAFNLVGSIEEAIEKGEKMIA